MQPLISKTRGISKRMRAYRVVPYAAEHKAAVAELQRHLWSPDVRLNADYLEWKYHQNPYLREPLLYLAFHGDQLVGMRGVFATRWEAGDPPQYFTLAYPDDLVTDPAHRGRGLHRLIMEFALNDLAKRGFRYAVNLSASRITAQLSRHMGWRSAGGVAPIHRRTLRKRMVDDLADRVRRAKFFWRWADSVAALCLPSDDRAFDRLDVQFQAETKSNHAETLFMRTAPLVREMEGLVRRLPRDGRIRHVRDETYFTWRFRNPLRSYRFLYAMDEKLMGYLVLQRPRATLGPPLYRVSIVDWEAETNAIRAELATAAIEHGRFPELCAWRLGLSAPAAGMLESHGFEPVRSQYETSILVRSLREEDSEVPWLLGGRSLDDGGQWDLRMLYSMAG
jgi:GNAT superfamily N-acetyltransferase